MAEHASSILIADDEPHILRALGFILENEGYQLHYAMDGEEALALAREHHPQLAILDIMMPALDGFQVCRRIKEDRDLQDMAVIFLTAKGQDSDYKQALALGARQYLTKPFSPSEVVQVVRSLVHPRS